MSPHSSAMQDIEQRSYAPPKQSIERGISSAGRAPALQAGGRRFDPVILHHHQRRQEVIRSFNTKAALSRNVKGLFVVDQYHLINRLFFKNS